MTNPLKSFVETIDGILRSMMETFSDPADRREFLLSIGCNPDEAGSDPQFPPGSAMQQYYQSQKDDVDITAFKAAMAEVGDIIEVLRDFFGSMAATYASGQPGANEGQKLTLAVSELITATLNIFTLGYVRQRHPRLHNLFTMLGVLDDMGQRAGGSGFAAKVAWDWMCSVGRGAKLETQDDVNRFMELLGLVLNVLRFSLFSETPIFFSPGYEGFASSTTKNADKASEGMISIGWFFDPKNTENNLYLTLGLLPKTRLNRGFVANIRSVSAISKTFDDGLKLDITGGINGIFFYSDQTGFDASAGSQNKFSIKVTQVRPPEDNKLLDKPYITLGFGDRSLELRITKDDLALIAKLDVLFQFQGGTARDFPFGELPLQQDGEKFSLPVGWSLKRGWFIDGGGSPGINPNESNNNGTQGTRSLTSRDGGELPKPGKANLFFLNIPLQKSVKGLKFQYLHLGLGRTTDQWVYETSVDFSLTIAEVVTIAMTRVGMRLNVTPRDDMGGVLGQDFDVDFKPPTGVGVVVKAGPVKGGGFLSFDQDKGEYMGAVELEFADFTLKAVGILNTKIPNGKEGDYSFLILVLSEFEPKRLPLGFTLKGVGGILGLHRDVNLQRAQEELRGPTLENILFPPNPVANIARITNDLNRIFPIAKGKFLAGLAGKFGWLGGDLLNLEFGLILTWKEWKLLMPGMLKLEVPKKSKILKLNAYFLGVVDFKENYLFFRADLVNSKLWEFKLTGSLVFGVGWGSNVFSVVSIGGFHPAFYDLPSIPAMPNAFRNLDRLAVPLWQSGDNKLLLEAYLAFTSNSAQVGAHAYLHIKGPMGFNIDGHLGFDALFYFHPFHFLVDIDARIDFRHGSEVLACVQLSGQLSGPSPWHVEGKAKLKICWCFSVSIPFSKTWGDPATTEIEQSVDLLEVFHTELSDNRNWRAEGAEFHYNRVSLRPRDDEAPGEILVQPLGALVFSQRALPLGQSIQKFGDAKPSGINIIKINSISSGATVFEDLDKTTELFAPGNFTELDDHQQLSRKSFETMESGVRIGDTGASVMPQPFLPPKPLEYELSYIAPDLPATGGGKVVLSADRFQRLSRSSSVAQSTLSWQSGRGHRTATQAVGIAVKSFAIAGTDDLRLFTNGTSTGFTAQSQAEAIQLHRQLLQEHPELEGKIQVVAAHELIF